MLKRFPKPTHLTPFKWRGFFLFGLLGLILLSLIGIISVQHQIRHLETDYYHALQQTIQAQEEWGRLMLEKTHLSAPARVEQLAQSKLGMVLEKSQQHNLQILYLPEPHHED
jgi:cell division protein FtsL